MQLRLFHPVITCCSTPPYYIEATPLQNYVHCLAAVSNAVDGRQTHRTAAG
ncbi:MAG: hypothetical protein HXL36_10130, partial [Prevotellaceae bacterium]|nr:hypothetical protein [Prevotellaceae bacterium]